MGDASPATTPAPIPAATIELIDCIARGEAVLLRAEDLQPVRLAWDNGLLATTERLLSATGHARTPPSGQALQVELRHLTAVVRSGLCRIAGSQTAPHLLPLQFTCADSILMGGAGSTLIEQVGEGDVDDFRRQITWNGDRNCYDGFEVFWSIRRLDSETPPDQMNFEAWKTHWGSEHENLCRFGRVDWRKLPAADRPLDRATPADYALNEKSAANPAVGTASDGRDIGMEAARLPAGENGSGVFSPVAHPEKK